MPGSIARTPNVPRPSPTLSASIVTVAHRPSVATRRSVASSASTTCLGTTARAVAERNSNSSLDRARQNERPYCPEACR
jgi:hypothetical protein